MNDVLHALLKGKRLTPAQAGSTWPDKPGIYAFFVDSPASLPTPYCDELLRRGTDLIYIGKAEISLWERGFNQDLRHRSAAAFFRSLGAALGYVPEFGSLVGKKNQNNYRFSKQARQQIIEWIDVNLRTAALTPPASKIVKIEASLIRAATPLLNDVHNPLAFTEIQAARGRCRTIARGLEPVA